MGVAQFKRILVATDGSDNARRAVEIAVDLAEKYEADLYILSVYKPVRIPDSSHSLVRSRNTFQPTLKELSTGAHAIADEALAVANEHEIPKVEVLVRKGPPARTIIDVAEQANVDAIVMGSRGLGDVSGLLLGSVSHKVASLARCSCITVK